MWMWIAIGVGVALFLLWARRSNEQFYVSVRDGKVLLVRGRLPQALLNDFRTAVEKPPVARGSIRGVKTPNGVQVYADGDIDELLEQRLRNILRIYPVAQLRSAPPPGRPTLGQLLGIAWLAWLLDRSFSGPGRG